MKRIYGQTVRESGIIGNSFIKKINLKIQLNDIPSPGAIKDGITVVSVPTYCLIEWNVSILHILE